MYTSQFQKIYPYDWFCGQGHTWWCYDRARTTTGPHTLQTQWLQHKITLSKTLLARGEEKTCGRPVQSSSQQHKPLTTWVNLLVLNLKISTLCVVWDWGRKKTTTKYNFETFLKSMTFNLSSITVFIVFLLFLFILLYLRGACWFMFPDLAEWEWH